MLKPQDIVILLKLLANSEHLDWPQHQLATHLCLSLSAINASLTRLNKSGLVHFGMNDKRYQLVKAACEEVLIHGVKYFFPAELGTYTAGIPTSYAAPIFKGEIVLGQDPIPVWPSLIMPQHPPYDVQFTPTNIQRGLALEPLYHCVPDSLIQYPDQDFYDLLSLIDAMRHGRARERNLAVTFLKERLHRAKSK